MARAQPVHGLKADATVRANAQKIIATRTAEFFAFAPYLADPTNVTELHDMRIAAKRLRYALELFKDALDPDAADCITLVKEFQEIVGDIHDHDVLVGIMRAHLETLVMEHAHALADLAVNAGADEAMEAFKTRCRAFVTDKSWVAEQTAIAAAIARTTRERQVRYTDLVAQWDVWQTDGLRARLEALTVDPPNRGTAKKKRDAAEDLPTVTASVNGKRKNGRLSRNQAIVTS